MKPLLLFSQQEQRLTAVPGNLIRSIRYWLLFFMTALMLSGLTAFPIETLLKLSVNNWPANAQDNLLFGWFQTAYFAVSSTNQSYPFLAYGTDWLAFAHILFTILFIGPFRDPVKNSWVIDFGLIACAAIPLLAFIAGSMRQIPFYWQLLDSSFGLFGAIPLIIIRKKIKLLTRYNRSTSLYVCKPARGRNQSIMLP